MTKKQKPELQLEMVWSDVCGGSCEEEQESVAGKICVKQVGSKLDVKEWESSGPLDDSSHHWQRENVWHEPEGVNQKQRLEWDWPTDRGVDSRHQMKHIKRNDK